MAKIINGQISGRIGDRVYYQLNGKTVVRSMPYSSKKIELKDQHIDFCTASSLGKAIRFMLLPAIPNPTEQKMHAKLFAVLHQWLRSGNLQESVTMLRGFEFCNQQFSPVNMIPMKLSIPDSESAEIDILPFTPTENVRGPLYTTHIVCNIAMMNINMETGIIEWGSAFARLYPYNTKPCKKEMLISGMKTTKGSLVICAASSKFIVSAKHPMSEKINQSSSRAGIVDAIYFD